METKKKKGQEWIEQGYKVVSEKGFKSLNIESIARSINKSKSSFYHYFGDLQGYKEALLIHHLELAKDFVIKVKKCKSILPDLVNVFIDHKTDIFFHKQLRINRIQPNHKQCFEAVFGMFEEAILDQWVAFLKLENHRFLASKFLNLLSDNFLFQITQENFNRIWLKEYLVDISKLLMDINLKDNH